MKISKLTDTLLNVFFPLLAGCLIYTTGIVNPVFLPVKNFLPDGLWAYSFLSAILILWDRRINFSWILIIFLLSASFEYLQYLNWISGTGDIIDVFIYFSFFGLSLLTNQFLKKNNKFHASKIFGSAHEK